MRCIVGNYFVMMMVVEIFWVTEDERYWVDEDTDENELDYYHRHHAEEDVERTMTDGSFVYRSI